MSWVLHLGDCLDPVTGLASLGDRSVDHVITDPPYDDRTHVPRGNVRRCDGGSAIAAIPFATLGDPAPYAEQIGRVVRRWAMVFCAVRQIESWSCALENVGCSVPRVMIWVKPDASPQFSGDRPGHGYESIVLAHPKGKTRWNGGGHKGVFEHCRIDRTSEFLHPTQKPVPLLAELAALFTDPGDTILDPFAGSGTTGVAAIRLGRNFIGWEKNPKYHAAAMRRLSAAREQLSLLGPRTKAKQETLL